MVKAESAGATTASVHPPMATETTVNAEAMARAVSVATMAATVEVMVKMVNAEATVPLTVPLQAKAERGKATVAVLHTTGPAAKAHLAEIPSSEPSRA